jgi:hypothetical protein
MTSTKTAQVLNKFAGLLQVDEEYTSKDMVKLLETAYKAVHGGRRKAPDAEKKAPSAYNLFIKSEIEKIKGEKIEGVDPKDYMKLAAQRWKENKGKA